MSTTLGDRTRWMVVAGYAVAMAWVESAVVYYLRTMVDRIEPYQPNPLPIIGGLGPAEMVREAATLIMLLAVGVLAGNSWRSRLGYTAVAFGIWDIFYYVFLKVLCGWPYSLLDWDILFLLPLPWWGPVLAPVLISILMIAWGTLSASERQHLEGAELKSWVLNAGGVVLALGVFMTDTLRVASQGTEAVRRVLPQRFSWFWFSLALVLMSAPLAFGLRRRFLSRTGGAVKDDLVGEPLSPQPTLIPVEISNASMTGQTLARKP
jgi:hypothetical protein